GAAGVDDGAGLGIEHDGIACGSTVGTGEVEAGVASCADGDDVSGLDDVGGLLEGFPGGSGGAGAAVAAGCGNEVGVEEGSGFEGFEAGQLALRPGAIADREMGV